TREHLTQVRTPPVRAGLFLHPRCQLFAKAAIAASRVAAVAVRRCAIPPKVESQRPHPRASYGRSFGLEDAPDHEAIGEHVVIVVAPLTGSTRGGCAFEDQRRGVHCSRCRRRRARNSSPRIGWTDGVPFFALRTCRRPAVNSTCDHSKSQSSHARRPCL